MPAELCEDCVRDGSDAHLEAGTVIDKCSTVLSYRDLHFIRIAEMRRLERVVSFHEYIYHIHRNHRISPGARHIRVHDGDHGLCAFDGRKGSVN